MNESEAQKKELALIKKDVVDVVATRVQQLIGEGQLQLPQHYAVGNAVMAWWLALQSCEDKDHRPALEVCTKNSIANATLDMVVQGLDPSKKQCYPVVYGRKLVCQRSYFGEEALLRRARPDVVGVYPEVVYQGDTLEYEIRRGQKVVTKHVQKVENIGGLEKIVAGYVVIEGEDEKVIHCELMTIEQIKRSWQKSKTYDGKRSTFHTEQPEEAVKRTVIRRASKRLINSSNDHYLIRAVERQAHLAAEAEMEASVEAEANKEVLTFPEKSAKAPTDVIEAEIDEDGDEPEGGAPSSPSARFLDFIEAHEFDPSKARRLAAKIHELDDVRKLTNDHYAEVLKAPEAFVALYTDEYLSKTASASQGKLGGPGF